MQYSEATTEKNLRTKIQGYHDRAATIKAEHSKKAEAIKKDERLTPIAKRDDLSKLAKATNEQLRAIKDEQLAYVAKTKSDIESAIRGGKPTDASSILLRRDARDRARKIESKQDAMEQLTDAIADGDDTLAHEIGQRARARIWVDVADVYKEQYASTSSNMAALAVVESLEGDGGYNFTNSVAYSEVSA